MSTTIEERMEIYRCWIPRLTWFNEEEQYALVGEAERNANQFNGNFWTTLENLAFMKSFEKGLPKGQTL